ncbi:MAG: MogA/MoaB family molybdenum cofactor biosynthesis protein [Clostridiales bacterium]|nr:MogA/MoaB family molybdenum cofactor biosynthesis protein [Clostridiales bacterium]
MALKTAVITVSDRCSRGEKEDLSGPAVARLSAEKGLDVIYASVVPDEKEEIKKELIKCSDALHADIVLTTGGTGFSKRDVTPEATMDVIEREAPFIPEAMLFYSLKITPNAMLSRMKAGIRGDTVIINLPGSPKAATENLGAVIDTFPHAVKMLHGEGH